jgi:hypothetical protein
VASEFPNSYKDPVYASLDAKTEEKLGLPSGLLSSIRTKGEKSNNDQVSDAGAKTVYQFTPSTRNLIVKKYGIDPYLSPETASESAGLLLKEGLDRNKGDPALAVAEYIGGTDRANWGPTTRAYVARVAGGLPAPSAPAAKPAGAPLAPGESTFDKVMAQQAPKASPMAAVLQAYQSGQMSPEDAKTFESEVNAGRVMLPRGVTLKGAAVAGPPAMPNALAVAYQSGKMDPKDRAQLDDLIKQGVIAAPVGASQIPGQTEGAPSDVSKAVPDPTIGERIVGAGEAGLNAVTGMTGGTLGAITGTVSGMFDPNVGNLQQLSDSATRGAAALTYQPRTASGQDQAAVVGNVMQNAVPLMGMGGEMASAAQAANALKPTVAAIPQIARNTASTAGQAVAQGVRAAVPDVIANIPGRVREMVGGAPSAPVRPTPGTMGSVGAAGVDMATQRRMAAADLPVPIELTEGQATRDFAQQRFERETAKNPELGAPLRQKAEAQNADLLRNFDAMVDQTGSATTDLRGTGQSVVGALREQMAKDKAKIRTAYKEAEKAGEMEAPVTLTGFVDHLNENAPDAAVAPLLTSARNRALQLGIAAEGPDGALVALPVPLKIAETGRRAISNAMGIDPTNIYHGTLLKQSIDSATEGLGGGLYRAARAERTRLAQNYENHAAVSDLLGMKRGSADRQVALEDVFRRSVVANSADGLKELRRVLQRSGDSGQQAWRDLQGQTIQHLKEQGGFKNSARDSMGNPVITPDGLHRAVAELDRGGKLEILYGKKGAEIIRTLDDVANHIKTWPANAVNTSNTASVLAGLIDVAATAGSGGLPLPIATGLRLAVTNIKDRRIRARVDAALGIKPGNRTIH